MRWRSSRRKRTKDLLLWMLSTKMMPAVGVLVPIYLLCARHRAARHARRASIIVYTLINLPIVVWMLFTFFNEVPQRHPGGGPHRRRASRGRRSSIC